MDAPLLSRYINHDKILQKLIAIRCAKAEVRQKKLVLKSYGQSKLQQKDTTEEFLYKIFPPRKQWVHAGKDARQGKTQVEKNKYNLRMTYSREKKMASHAEWFIELEKYIDTIQKLALDGTFQFDTPNVSAIQKDIDNDKKEIIARPICQFKTLEERIIGSLYNRAITNLFDPYFYDKSYAFRVSSKNDSMPHLKAVEAIMQFRQLHKGEILWVAECDMKKFFDTIDHAVIKRLYMNLLKRCLEEKKITDDEFKLLQNVMFSYVDCFAFYRDVLIYSEDEYAKHTFWRNVHIKEGYTQRISWVNKDIDKLRSSGKWPYPTSDYETCNLGIPQGGAMSGLIANIVMNDVDVRLRPYLIDSPNFLYIRFCDDMIMMGTEHTSVQEAFESYKQGIKNLNLFIHDDVDMNLRHMRDFWDGKTRAPYKWGKPGEQDVMPWITFVGYDINWEADTRIRKKTVKKELGKQFEKYNEVKQLLKQQAPRRYKTEILESVTRRMIGMSVGRVTLWNYKNFDNKYSWAKAFQMLTYNPWAKSQLRLLDRHRRKILKYLEHFLNQLSYEGLKEKKKDGTTKRIRKERRDLSLGFYYGKPFSYYGQVFKRWKKE